MEPSKPHQSVFLYQCFSSGRNRVNTAIPASRENSNELLPTKPGATRVRGRVGSSYRDCFRAAFFCRRNAGQEGYRMPPMRNALTCPSSSGLSDGFHVFTAEACCRWVSARRFCRIMPLPPRRRAAGSLVKCMLDALAMLWYICPDLASLEQYHESV